LCNGTGFLNHKRVFVRNLGESALFLTVGNEYGTFIRNISEYIKCYKLRNVAAAFDFIGMSPFKLSNEEKCLALTSSTRRGCLNDTKKLMWTYNDKRKTCERKDMDSCNDHRGNIFEKEDDCKTSCIAPIFE